MRTQNTRTSRPRHTIFLSPCFEPSCEINTFMQHAHRKIPWQKNQSPGKDQTRMEPQNQKKNSYTDPGTAQNHRFWFDLWIQEGSGVLSVCKRTASLLMFPAGAFVCPPPRQEEHHHDRPYRLWVNFRCYKLGFGFGVSVSSSTTLFHFSFLWGETPEPSWAHIMDTKGKRRNLAIALHPWLNAICCALRDTNMVWVTHCIGDGRLVLNVLGRGWGGEGRNVYDSKTVMH